MSRLLFFVLLAATAIGCGGSSATKLTASDVSFTTIENAVQDLSSTINDPNYQGASDLGSDSDRIGFALRNLSSSVQGKPVAADVEEIGKKLAEVDQLAASGAPVDKQREAVRALQATVAAAKAKM